MRHDAAPIPTTVVEVGSPAPGAWVPPPHARVLGADRDADLLAPNPDRSAAWLHVSQVRWPELARTRQRILEALRDQAAPLLRTDRPAHITGSALVIDPVSRRTLVVFHRKLRRWLQPGGHADGDGNLAAVALREATEETGISSLRVVVPAVDLDIHTVRPPDEDTHEHLDVRFVVIAPPGAQARPNHEADAARWTTVDELVDLGADAGLMRLARRALDT